MCMPGNRKYLTYLHFQILEWKGNRDRIIEYGKLFSVNTNKLRYILRRFEENLDIREKYPNMKKEGISGHEILSRDPLLSILLDHSNGYLKLGWN